MEECHVFEPNHLARLGMGHNVIEYLSRPQTVATFPLIGDRGFAAIIFNRQPIGCLKGSLPGKTDTITVIAHVLYFLLNESVFEFLVKITQDFATIRDRCLSTTLGRSSTEEPEFHRPTACVRLFVVKVDILIGWVIG